MKMNKHYSELKASYLFVDIAHKVAAYQEAHPEKEIIRLGIGDVTQPLAKCVVKAMHDAADEMGTKEGFHGYMPGVLWELLQEHLIDYVAMDIKASKDNYARAAGLPYIDISRIEESIGILKSSGIPYEFRTTVVKGIHTVGEFEEIGRWIEGCPAYYLQSYQENDNCLYRMIQTAESNAVKPGGAEVFGAFSREELEQMAELARKHVGKVVLRGVVGT